jgi:hypothetical protein
MQGVSQAVLDEASFCEGESLVPKARACRG